MDDKTLTDRLIEIQAVLLSVTRIVLIDSARIHNRPVEEVAASYKKLLRKHRQLLSGHPPDANSLDWPDILDSEE